MAALRKITPNGIDQERFKDIPMKEPDDEYINVGAVLRVTPIKDVKTMIMAFGYAKNNNPIVTTVAPKDVPNPCAKA